MQLTKPFESCASKQQQHSRKGKQKAKQGERETGGKHTEHKTKARDGKWDSCWDHEKDLQTGEENRQAWYTTKQYKKKYTQDKRGEKKMEWGTES